MKIEIYYDTEIVDSCQLSNQFYIKGGYVYGVGYIDPETGLTDDYIVGEVCK